MKKRNERIERVKVTPEMAREFLASSLGNRDLNAGNVKTLLAHVNAGTFHPSSTCYVDWDGHLIDGHHRMAAIAISGMTVEVTIHYDVDPEFRHFIDRGRARQVADDLKERGIPNQKKRAAAVAATVRLLAGTHTVKVGDVALYDTFTEAPGLKEAFCWWFSPKGNRAANLVQPHYDTAFVGSVFVLAHKHAVDAGKLAKLDALVESTLTGEGLSRGDPALTLRDFLARKPSREEAQPKTAHAILATLRGDRLQKLTSSFSALEIFRAAYDRTKVLRLLKEVSASTTAVDAFIDGLDLRFPAERGET